MRAGPVVFEFGRRTFVCGIVNMTPDSFAGDGLAGDAGAAEARGHAMRADGADLLDVGGRSTRPGAPQVDVEEELRRTIPAIRRLTSVGLPISVDTSSAAVARAALDAGAAMINDVTALRGDPAMGAVAARAAVPVVLAATDDRTAAPDPVSETVRVLRERIAAAVAHGIDARSLIVDPGYGFGLALWQNMALLRHLDALRTLGRPVLIGTSRKGSIGRVLNLPVHDRVEGTAATVAVAIARGADIIRVHDVRAMVRVARMTDAIVRGADGPPGLPP